MHRLPWNKQQHIGCKLYRRNSDRTDPQQDLLLQSPGGQQCRCLSMGRLTFCNDIAISYEGWVAAPLRLSSGQASQPNTSAENVGLTKNRQPNLLLIKPGQRYPRWPTPTTVVLEPRPIFGLRRSVRRNPKMHLISVVCISKASYTLWDCYHPHGIYHFAAFESLCS